MSKLLLGVIRFFGIWTDRIEFGPILYHIFSPLLPGQVRMLPAMRRQRSSQRSSKS